MSRTTTQPAITPIMRGLTAEDAREIIEIAKRAEARRVELAAQMRAALDANDHARVVELARAWTALEESQ